MEVYLLCIAIEGVDDRIAWSTFIVGPEGFVEEKSGLLLQRKEQSSVIKEGLGVVPSRAHVQFAAHAVRYCNLERRLLPNYHLRTPAYGQS